MLLIEKEVKVQKISNSIHVIDEIFIRQVKIEKLKNWN